MTTELLPTEVPLPDGRHLTVRAATPSDVDAVVRLYGSLSLDDRYRRFFSGFHPRSAFVAEWISAAERGGCSLVAEVSDPSHPEQSPELVAEAGYAKVSDGGAEFAITVGHDWRGWLGPFLLDVLVDFARQHGVTVLEAEVLTENRPMRRVVDHRGSAVFDRPDLNIVRVAIATDGTVPPWPPSEQRVRVLVESPGAHWRGDAALRTSDIAVANCGGPNRSNADCPALRGEPCPLASGATLIVCALPPDDPRTAALIDAHTRVHPGVPVLDESSDDLRSCRTSAEVLRRIEAELVAHRRG